MAERGHMDKGKGTKDKGKKKVFPNWAVRKPRSVPKPTNLASTSVIDISSDSDDSASVEEISPPRCAPPHPPRTKKKEQHEAEIPPDAKLLLDCEAADILQEIHEKLAKLEDLIMPVAFDKALLQTKDGIRYSNTKDVRETVETLKEYGVTDWEICMIANAGPKTCEEAYAMIPSLRDKEDGISGPLNAVLAKLAFLKLKDVDRV
ncbi:DNA-directed RNA polymerases IV and V subunit 4-like [Phalaenopsis equestris]|uniref:DNA-directed RNA polymerases IV and V subunit 4-like n=1 Tax=Phalaenopsis equestris TaxID=78828 RepID=UPI0009E5A238|nr:DNA-directed RNA polymerases IV and V subunit 4-like [Phalaenopsis equestris]